jgi:DNA replication licensing factor MCM7
MIDRHYIALARQKRPTVPPQVSNYVVNSYVRLRKVSKDEEQENKSHTYTSARTLLGVLRLAQALARLRFSNTVEHADVDEALRLMDVSKESLQEDADKEYEPDKSAVSQIFRLIKGMAGTGGKSRRKRRRLGKGPGRERDMNVDSDEDEETDELQLIDIRARVLNSGFTEVQLNDTIAEVCLMSVRSCRRLINPFYFCSTRISMCGCVLQMEPNFVS